MRRRFYSIRILLLLVPYLCLAAFGMLPHVHQGQGIAFVGGGCSCAACLAQQRAPALCTADDCALCQWQRASMVCSAALPALLLPASAMPEAPKYAARMAATTLIFTTSRAPPLAVDFV